jgi:hypothetical protein
VSLTAQQLDTTYEGKRLRVNFRDGMIAEIKLLFVQLPNEFDNTPESWGIIYDLISANRPPAETKDCAYWSRLDDIESFEIMEEGIA